MGDNELRDRRQEAEGELRQVTREVEDIQNRIKAGEHVPTETVVDVMRRFKEATQLLGGAVQDEGDE